MAESEPQSAASEGEKEEVVGKPRPPLSQQPSRMSRTSAGVHRMMSARSTLRSQISSSKQQQPATKWGRVKKAVKSGTLVAVGLKQTEEEKLHWNAVQSSIYVSRATRGQQPQSPSQSTAYAHPSGVQRTRSNLSYRDIPAAHIAAYPYRQPSSVSVFRVATPTTTPTSTQREEVDFKPPKRTASEPPGADEQAPPTAPPPPLQRQRSLYGTGRVQAVRTDLKPDLWKLAYQGVRRLASFSLPPQPTEEAPKRESVSAAPKAPAFKSFIDLGEEEGEEELDQAWVEKGAVERGAEDRVDYALRDIREEDEDFFGSEIDEKSPLSALAPPLSPTSKDGVDAAIARIPPSIEHIYVPPSPKPKLAPKRRARIGLPAIIYDPLFGGYDRGYGGLGLPSHLLRFKYKDVPSSVQRRLDAELLHKRPYFTYWLIVVHFIIMVTALSVYGFAPYGWDQKVERGTVYGSNLAYDTQERIVIPSVWLGPSQQSLVLLGALYGPCMRRDRQLFEAIDEDRSSERNNSGCCVRRDDSGCVQVPSRDQCGTSFTEFVYETDTGDGNSVRGVCGTSPRTCSDPRPGLDPDSWVPDNILTWPICLDDTNENSTESHLSCEITGRPCCVGIQALCLITTREHCDFLNGRFHQEAFLCSQVDCLNTTCGLLPFRVFNEPDQVYRLWIALFMHAGLLHLLLSITFSFSILRHVEKRLGWLRTAILYIISGVGGNLVNAFFAPYNPEVGPAGSILGVVAYMFVFLIFESRLLRRPWVEFLKLGVVVLLLFLLGLFPFIANFAHIGGFVFGFLLSGILVPYHSLEYADKGNKKEKPKYDIYRIIKWAMVIVGIPAVLLLFVLFFILFYVVQDTWDGFRYLNCIPFTSTICQDLGGNIRTRDSHII